MNKNIIKLISEEINNFDFLSNEADEKYGEYEKILNDLEFQKRFIGDVIGNKFRDKIKTTEEIIHFVDNLDHDMKGMMLEIEVEVEYNYKDSILNFSLFFNGENVKYRHDEEKYTTIDWSDIEVDLFNEHGNEVKFEAFENASETIQNVFIRMFIQHLIERKSLDVGEKWMVPGVN